METRVFSTSFLLLSAAFLSILYPLAAASTHNISAVFAFGDSTLDSGNNDVVPTLVRANHPPYGQDFPGRVATGRFSNGKLITDFLVSSLGLKDSLPAFLSPGLTPSDLATGVSFASAGSGLDDLTATLSKVINISRQVEYFESYIRGQQSAMGKEPADRLIKDSVFIIGAGSNDMMLNLYTFPTRRSGYSVSNYDSFLLQKMEALVKQLYSMGGRKFTIAGLPPIGCLPVQITWKSMTPGSNPFERTCIDQQNNDAIAYNTKLRDLITSLQTSLSGTKFAYVDIYNPLMDMINNPSKYGFTETTRGCCGTGTMEMGPTCSIPLPTCPDPSKFLFWDSVHPSQATYEALASQFMKTVLPQIS